MYELLFDEEAIEFLNKLPKDLKERIFNKLITAKENPFHFLEHLEDMKGHKLRIGDYRIILDIDKSKLLILIIKVGHRRNIYD